MNRDQFRPRIPLITRGSTFHFPTSRVLREIEVEGFAKRDGPEPSFMRYGLHRQPPRQHVFNTANKYNTLPATHIVEEIPEGEFVHWFMILHRLSTKMMHSKCEIQLSLPEQIPS